VLPELLEGRRERPIHGARPRRRPADPIHDLALRSPRRRRRRDGTAALPPPRRATRSPHPSGSRRRTAVHDGAGPRRRGPPRSPRPQPAVHVNASAVAAGSTSVALHHGRTGELDLTLRRDPHLGPLERDAVVGDAAARLREPVGRHDPAAESCGSVTERWVQRRPADGSTPRTREIVRGPDKRRSMVGTRATCAPSGASVNKPGGFGARRARRREHLPALHGAGPAARRRARETGTPTRGRTPEHRGRQRSRHGRTRAVRGSSAPASGFPRHRRSSRRPAQARSGSTGAASAKSTSVVGPSRATPGAPARSTRAAPGSRAERRWEERRARGSMRGKDLEPDLARRQRVRDPAHRHPPGDAPSRSRRVA
jgi:hypothetical protein